jgi:hypothetical protein
MKLVSLQGNVYVANRDTNGNPLAFRHLGNVPSIEITLESGTVDHFESTSGQRLQDGRLIISKTAGLSMTLDEWTTKNLALALYGTDAVIAGSTVTAEVFPAGLVNGDFVRLTKQDVSAVVIKDSAGVPVTLVEGTDYQITSAKHGTIKILNVGTYIQPFKADYTYAGGTNIALFSAAPPELWLKVDGVNTAEANKPVLAELYRVILDPVAALALIHNEGYGPMELSGAVLYDATKVADTTLGQFGHMVEMA